VWEAACQLHYQRNKHHWNRYLKDGKLYPMQFKYLKEMLADWRGAGRVYGTDTKEWYLLNKSEIALWSFDREWIEEQLGI